MDPQDITPKQQTILTLLYTHRFLNRTHIQSLMQHKDKRRINTWLKDLSGKQYITRIYNAGDFIEKTKPAIYHLGLNGIRFLKTLNKYPPEALRKRYYESSRQQDFIDRSLLIADCSVELSDRSVADVHYLATTQAMYHEAGFDYTFLTELQPKLVIEKQEIDVTTSYLLEIFDASLPRYGMKKRLSAYVTHLAYGEWEYATGDDTPPTILVLCPTTATLTYAKRQTRKLLADTTPDKDFSIQFATIKDAQAEGITAGVWESV